MSENYLPNKVRVTVNGSVYEIPSFKLMELQRLLASWQSIQVQHTENQNLPNGDKWNGTQLING